MKHSAVKLSKKGAGESCQALRAADHCAQEERGAWGSFVRDKSWALEKLLSYQIWVLATPGTSGFCQTSMTVQKRTAPSSCNAPSMLSTDEA